MSLWNELDAGSKVPEIVNVIIEAKSGSRNKYVYDVRNAVFMLACVLAPSLRHPADIGVIPKTLGDDNKPVGTVVLCGESTFPGCVLKARPIGIVRMNWEGHRSDKLLTCAISDPDYANVKDISEIPNSLIDTVSNFFVELGALENAAVEVIGIGGVEDAHKLITHATRLFLEQHAMRTVSEDLEE